MPPPSQVIPIFIGYDPRERAATNVLIDSLYQHSSVPLAITPLVTPQLEAQNLFRRERDPKQSTAFSFTRFLVPHLMGYDGWAIFMDCDMLCREDIKLLWDQRDDTYGVMCVQHEHVPGEAVKFLGEVQSAYPKKKLEFADAAQLQPLHQAHTGLCEHRHGSGAAPLPLAGG